jgi:hypothetical protein
MKHVHASMINGHVYLKIVMSIEMFMTHITYVYDDKMFI